MMIYVLAGPLDPPPHIFEPKCRVSFPPWNYSLFSGKVSFGIFGRINAVIFEKMKFLITFC